MESGARVPVHPTETPGGPQVESVGPKAYHFIFDDD